MNLFGNVMLMTDLSKNSQEAIPWVLEIARLNRSKIYLCHVFEDTIYYASALGNISFSPDFPNWLKEAKDHRKSELEKLASEIKKIGNIDVVPKFCEGHAIKKALSLVQDLSIDCVVMATHGYTGLSHIVLGSFAEKCVRLSPCPVLSVHKGQLFNKDSIPRKLAFNTILVPTDLSENADSSLKYAIWMTKQSDGKLYLVLVINDKLYVSDHDKTGNQFASWMLKEHREMHALLVNKANEIRTKEKIEVVPMLRHGNPALEIVQAAREVEADCIAIATHGRSGIPHLFLGSVSEKVVRQSECPVLSIRPKRLETEQRTMLRTFENH